MSNHYDAPGHVSPPRTRHSATANRQKDSKSELWLVGLQYQFPVEEVYPTQLETLEDNIDLTSQNVTTLEYSTVIFSARQASGYDESSHSSTESSNGLSLQTPLPRPWEQQLIHQQYPIGLHDYPDQVMLARWESQYPIDEPFHNVRSAAQVPEHYQHHKNADRTVNCRHGDKKKHSGSKG